MNVQRELPGMTPPPDEHIYPPDIDEALRTVIGALDVIDKDNLPEELTGEDLKNKIATGKHTLLKKFEKIKVIFRRVEYRVGSFDLANEEDCRKYEALLNEAGDSTKKLEMQVTPPVMMLDPRAKRGFRSIVSFRMFRQDFEQVPETKEADKFTEVSDQSVRERVAQQNAANPPEVKS